MKVLVVCGGGYIGSILTEMLVERGFDTVVLDRFSAGTRLFDDLSGKIRTIKQDIRAFDPAALDGIDAVMDMTTVTTDAKGDKNPQETMDVNYSARARIAALAKKHGVKRYILAAPLYGYDNQVVTEETEMKPQTTYSKAAFLCEKDDFALADGGFTVTALRQPSVYGLSRRMKFDTAVNVLALKIFRKDKLMVRRPGDQLRPFVHVRDTSSAFMAALEAEKDKVQGQIFNVGSNDQNFKVLDLARAVADGLGVPFNYEWYGEPDLRSYSANFDKIRSVLGFRTKYTVGDGAREVFNALRNGELDATKYP